MNTKNLFFILMLWGICTLTACDKEDVHLIRPSADLVHMEGEGGEELITFQNGNWIIDRIENRSVNEKYLSGDIYSADGQIVAENTLLQLSGLGKIISNGDDCGLVIIRERTDALAIHVKENLTGKIIRFAIVLQSGTEEKEIIINQNISQGYTFGQIEYVLEEDDQESFYVIQTRHSYPGSEEPTRIPVMPYSGLHELSWFTVSEPLGHYWLLQSETSVQVPAGIDTGTGNIILSTYHNPFSLDETMKETPYHNVVTSVEMPAGFPIVTIKLTWRRRQVSYYATLINNRTGLEKVVSGKWIETVPTSEYEIEVRGY